MRKRTINRHVKNTLFAAAVIASLGFCGWGGAQLDAYRLNHSKQQQEIVELQGQLEAAQHDLDIVTEELKATSAQLEADHNELEKLRREVSEGNARAIDVEVTAYDLSEQSCNKGPGHPAYGLTATGKNLAGHTLESARAIAVDPRLVPLGSKVRLTFKDKEMQKYNGIYTACDTGGAIQGNIIDLFAGDGAHALCMQIGRRQAKLEVI